MEQLYDNYCYYSDLPSPLAYMEEEEAVLPPAAPVLSAIDIDRIIEMAWEDRTPFDAIEYQFGLKESEVRQLMKQQLRFSSYKLWRRRVEACKTKHQKMRSADIVRFKCSRQRAITQNKISKR
jgi:uncharacterized protein (TIGR03643 family)